MNTLEGKKDGGFVERWMTASGPNKRHLEMDFGCLSGEFVPSSVLVLDSTSGPFYLKFIEDQGGSSQPAVGVKPASWGGQAGKRWLEQRHWGPICAELFRSSLASLSCKNFRPLDPLGGVSAARLGGTGREKKVLAGWLDLHPQSVAPNRRPRPAGIIQGGVHEDLRAESVAFVNRQPFFGTAIGGSLGADRATMHAVVGRDGWGARRD